MQINLEPGQAHSIQAYTDKMIQINSHTYEQSLIVSRTEIIPDLTIKTIQEMNQDYLALLLRSRPKIILIGHSQHKGLPPIQLISQLSKEGIGMECMSVGAACRTFNLLLGEDRAVVMGFIP